jgi:hypothetical protein
MAFWSTERLEPKRQHRWYVEFGSGVLDGLKYALKKVDKPKAEISTVEHKWLNHTFNYPGRLVWQDISMTFASVSDPDATNLLDVILERSGYRRPQGISLEEQAGFINATTTIGKAKMNAVIGQFDIIQVNPDGQPIEKWTIYKPLFTNVEFGSLEYGAEEIVEINCTVKYDWAQLNGQTVPTAGR